MPESKEKEIHPVWLRAIHWINFYTLLVMFYSGMLIYWAYPVYTLSVPGGEIPVLPKAWFKFLGMDFQLGNGLAYHLNFMWIIMATGILYVVFSLFSGHWKTLFPKKEDAKNLLQFVKYSLKLSKESPAQGKYNPAQKLVYFTTILVLILLIFSGWAIYKPARLSILVFLMGGYRTARAIHFLCTSYLFLFFIVHLIQVIRAGWTNFSAMVTGGQKVPVQENNPPSK